MAFGHPTTSYKDTAPATWGCGRMCNKKTHRKVVPVACCIPTCMWHLAGASGSVCVHGMNFCCDQGSRGVHWGTGERVRGQTARTTHPDYSSLAGASWLVTGNRLQNWMNVFLDLACWIHAKHIGANLWLEFSLAKGNFAGIRYH